MKNLNQERFISRSVEDTCKIASEFTKKLKGGTTILLKGDLGAGKTVFVKGAARELGIDPDQILSPTFVLHRRHKTDWQGSVRFVDHCDLYRLASSDEAREAGIHELIGQKDALLFVEWADTLTPFLSKHFLVVEINSKDDGREREIIISEQNL